MVALVAGFYLNITTRAAAAGSDVQNMLYQIQSQEHDIADLNTQLGLISSSSVMEKRALDLGFIPISSDQIKYLVVPGYTPRETPDMAPPPDNGVVQAPLILPDYTQSLWDYLLKNFPSSPVLKQGVTQP